ncbi:MAG: DUF1697 domain-containing protein [Balneolales bacterium]
METYIAILRGINVSGHKKIKMAALKQQLEALGFQMVRTYIQSGNVLFDHPKQDELSLAELISRMISREFGFLVPVIVKHSEAWKALVNNNPFLDNKGVEVTRLHATILAEKPDSELVSILTKVENPPDEFTIKGEVVYLHCPLGYGRTKFTNTFFENKLKVVATTRNWKTVLHLNEMASNPSF